MFGKVLMVVLSLIHSCKELYKLTPESFIDFQPMFFDLSQMNLHPVSSGSVMNIFSSYQVIRERSFPACDCARMPIERVNIYCFLVKY